jgi:hypothetical protein
MVGRKQRAVREGQGPGVTFKVLIPVIHCLYVGPGSQGF